MELSEEITLVKDPVKDGNYTDGFISMSLFSSTNSIPRMLGHATGTRTYAMYIDGG